jgi:transcriptional regulator with XRE-family HTH domain
MDLGITQAQLAAMAQISRKYLNRIENGLSVPSPELAQRLSEILSLFLP